LPQWELGVRYTGGRTRFGAPVSKARRALMMASLILAGESIYMLPYGLRRDYEPAMLDAMQVSATELGWLTSIFGVLAVLCYFPGGWLADRISARKLLTLSLMSTGLGGLYMASFPGYGGLVAIHALWGITTILTFWGALIKITRAWGTEDEQGRAFGLLEGGRGLVAFGLAVTGGVVMATVGSLSAGLRAVILLYSGAALFCGALTWIFIPEDPEAHRPEGGSARAPTQARGHGTNLRRVLSMPVVWLQAVVILTAYAGYWGTFDLAKLAVDGFGATETLGAAVSISAVLWRGVMAVSAGYLADRYGANRTVLLAFGLLFVACLVFAVAPTGASLTWLLWVNAAALGAATYALRGVYYALLEESRIPMHVTGLTVGLVSMLGYTPDVFLPPLKGWLTDTYPGVTGHRYFFTLLGAGALIGAAATVGIQRVVARSPSVSSG
jgi:MFS family permease